MIRRVISYPSLPYSLGWKKVKSPAHTQREGLKQGHDTLGVFLEFYLAQDTQYLRA